MVKSEGKKGYSRYMHFFKRYVYLVKRCICKRYTFVYLIDFHDTTNPNSL